MNSKVTGQLAVIAFTDGEPNCIPDPMVSMVPTMPEPDRAADWLGESSKSRRTWSACPARSA